MAEQTKKRVVRERHAGAFVYQGAGAKVAAGLIKVFLRFSAVET